MKKRTNKSLKKKAWTLFSLYIRWKHTDKLGVCKCVTCGFQGEPKDLQAGHFVDSRNNTVLFDEQLVHPQCYRCNVKLKGNKIKYAKFMQERYGYSLAQLDQLDDLKFRQRKLYKKDFEDLITELEEKLERVKKRWE